MKPIASLLLVLAVSLLEVSCIGPSPGGLQLIANHPPNAGLLRLQQLEAKHPGLAAFLKDYGLPDYTLETTGTPGRGVMLYYLGPGKAWLMVEHKKNSAPVFLGPETIQRKELNFLRAAKDLNQPDPKVNQ
ncbi:MAG: hypothetical protein JNJ83_03200 [Verrucomicrobiaceae bacterium]|nr:hypothetical protein [Verrucomicrobiaceae bacterium]